jgi:hypothetical protein
MASSSPLFFRPPMEKNEDVIPIGYTAIHSIDICIHVPPGMPHCAKGFANGFVAGRSVYPQRHDRPGARSGCRGSSSVSPLLICAACAGLCRARTGAQVQMRLEWFSQSFTGPFAGAVSE